MAMFVGTRVRLARKHNTGTITHIGQDELVKVHWDDGSVTILRTYDLYCLTPQKKEPPQMNPEGTYLTDEQKEWLETMIREIQFRLSKSPLFRERTSMRVILQGMLLKLED